MKKPVKVFCSYSHEDEKLRDKLEKHLSALKRNGIIDTWHDRKLYPGIEWKGQIDNQIRSAQIILLLVSPDFIASDYCYEIELTQAIERHNAGEAIVVPILLRPVDWKDTPIGKLQALPVDGRPVTTWPNSDEALLNVTEGIRALIISFFDNDNQEPTKDTEEKLANPLNKTSVIENTDRERWVLVFSAEFNEANKSKVNAIVEHLRKLSGDGELTLLKIEPGSLKLYLVGSRIGFEKLNSLYNHGKLKKVLGLNVKGIRFYYEDVLFHSNIPLITILGGKHSGTSVYTSVLTHELSKNIASRFGAEFTPVDDQTLNLYTHYSKNLYEKGEIVDPSKYRQSERNKLSRPMAYHFKMKSFSKKGDGMQAVSVVCLETAGEDLFTSEYFEEITRYIINSQGLIFLIDPLQIPSLQDTLRQKGASSPSLSIDPQELIIRTANLIRSALNMRLNKKIKTPIALTISKIDTLLPLLDTSSPVIWDSKHNGFFDLDDFKQVDKSMRRALNEWIGPGFDMFIRLHFEEYAYFGVSALGSSPGPDGKINKVISPHRVADPFLWLLYKMRVIPGMRGNIDSIRS